MNCVMNNVLKTGCRHINRLIMPGLALAQDSRFRAPKRQLTATDILSTCKVAVSKSYDWFINNVLITVCQHIDSCSVCSPPGRTCQLKLTGYGHMNKLKIRYVITLSTLCLKQIVDISTAVTLPSPQKIFHT